MDIKGSFIEENQHDLYEAWQRTDMTLSLAEYIEKEWLNKEN